MIDYADPKRIPLPQSIWSRMALWIARNASAMAIAFFVAGGALGITALAFRSPLISGVSVATVIVLSMILARAVQTNRRARAMLILEYLEQAVRLGMPLPEMLRASSLAERRPVSRRLEKLATAIEHGAPLGEALRTNVPELPARTIGLIVTGGRTNSLVPTLARLIRQDRNRLSPAVFHATFQRAYFLMILLLIGGGISFFAIFVMPKFEQILKDFRLPMPLTTAWLGWSAEWLAPAVIGISGLLVFWMYANAWHDTFDVRMRRANFLRGWRDRIKWMTPLVGAAERDRGMADVCFALSAALDVGMPIQTAILEASALQINRVLRHRLIRWSDLLGWGDDLAVAARKARLPSLLIGMLAPAVAGGNLADVFRFLAGYYNARADRGLAVWQAASLPLIVLLCGAVVALTMLSIFKPMILLIDRYAPYPPFRR